MTVAEAAEVFGVTVQNIRKHVTNQGLVFATASVEHLKALKDLGVVPLKAPSVNLLPKDTVKALVK